jgi:hypothetical protein
VAVLANVERGAQPVVARTRELLVRDEESVLRGRRGLPIEAQCHETVCGLTAANGVWHTDSVSRTVHTTPARIRAPRRVRAPFAPRSAAGAVRRNRLAGDLKQSGIILTADSIRTEDRPATMPRVWVREPRPGYFHPAPKPAILEALHHVGAVCTYGLRSIALVRAPAVPAARVRFGRLRIPGEVLLYDQAIPPWILPGRLADTECERLEYAGAEIEIVGDGIQTRVGWPGETLRDFMLFDVLMHELGHHMVQQYTGKRIARVRRTRDHEAFAAWLAARIRKRDIAKQTGLRAV